MEKKFGTVQNCFNSTESEILEKIREKPDRLYLYRRLARSLNKRGKSEEVAYVLKQALEIKPDDWETSIFLAKVYEDTGNIDGAIALSRKAIAMKPDSLTPYDRLQRIFIRSGRIEEAISLYTDVDRDNPFKEKSYERLYRILVDKAKDTDRAMNVLKEAIEVFGPDARRCKDLGRLLFKKGKWDEASEAFRKALSFKEDDIDIMNLMAWCRIEVEDYEGAEKYFRKITELKPNTFAALIGLAELNIRRGKLDEAQERLENLSVRYPDNTRIEVDFADLYLRRGDTDGAISRCDEALKRVPHYFIWEQIHGHTVLSEAYRVKDRVEDAEYHQVLAEGLSKGPDIFKALITIVEDRIKNGDLKLARRVIGRLLDLFPANTLGLVYLAEINMREERIKEAIACCERGLKYADPRYIEEQIRGHRLLARAYGLLNRQKEIEEHECEAARLEEKMLS